MWWILCWLNYKCDLFEYLILEGSLDIVNCSTIIEDLNRFWRRYNQYFFLEFEGRTLAHNSGQSIIPDDLWLKKKLILFYSFDILLSSISDSQHHDKPWEKITLYPTNFIEKKNSELSTIIQDFGSFFLFKLFRVF